MKPKFEFLRAEHDDTGGAGGGAAGTGSQESQQTPPAPAQEAPAKLGLVDRVVLQMQSKSHLQTEIQQLRTDLAARDGEVQQLRTENQRLAGELKLHQENEQKLADALKGANDQAQTANDAAAEMLRSKGIEPGKLPAATTESQETVEQLEEQLSKETDPKERFRLTQRIMALEGKAN